MSDKKHRTSLPGAFKYALSGIVQAARRERNLRIELVFAVMALVASALLALQPVEWVLIIILIVLVLSLELINSVLESVIDLASPEIHPLARYAKDVAAGAVLVAALGSIAGGCIIFVAAALRLWGS